MMDQNYPETRRWIWMTTFLRICSGGYLKNQVNMRQIQLNLVEQPAEFKAY